MPKVLVFRRNGVALLNFVERYMNETLSEEVVCIIEKFMGMSVGDALMILMLEDD